MSKIPQDDKRTFGVSLLANVLQYSFAENAEILQKILTEKINAAIADSKIQEEMGHWELVWGPVVYQAPLDVSVSNAL